MGGEDIDEGGQHDHDSSAGDQPTGRRRASAAAIVAVIGLVGTTGSAGAGDDNASTPVEGGTFTNILPADPGALDPHMSVLASTLNASAFAYDTLLYLSPDGELVSGLAESWEETPTSVTYTLREGVTCANGSPLTATTVADNFRFVADPANQSPQLGIFVPPGITAEADDAARTVTVSGEQPIPFLLRMTGLGLFIVCADGLADRSLLAAGTDGTGPFVLEDAVANDHYTYRVREGYAWGPGGTTSDEPGFPSEVVLSIVENESTAANLVLRATPTPSGSPGRTASVSTPKGCSPSRAGRSSVSSCSTTRRASRPLMSPSAGR